MDFKGLGENLGLEEDEYIEMLELFIESGGEDLGNLEAAIKEGDVEKAHEASHSIKGSSGSLVLDTIYDLAKSIDNILRVGKLDSKDEMVKELRNQYDILKSDILKSIGE